MAKLRSMPFPADQAGSRRPWSVIVQVVVAALLITGTVALIYRADRQAEQAALPEDWSIIRPPHEVSCLAFYAGALWTGGIDGLVLVDRQTGQQLPLPDGFPKTGYVHSLLVTSSGALFIGAETGLITLHNAVWQTIGGATTSAIGRVLCLLEVSPGEIWLGVDGGIICYKDSVLSPLDLGTIKPDKIDVLYQDQAKTVWAGCSTASNGLLLRCTADHGFATVTSGQLPHPCINALAEDAQDTLWVGTGFAGNGGAASLVDGVWQPVATNERLRTNKVRSLYVDSMERIWYGLEYDGVIIYDQGNWLELGPQDGLAGKEVKVVLEDSGSVYWLGTDEGLSRIILRQM